MLITIEKIKGINIRNVQALGGATGTMSLKNGEGSWFKLGPSHFSH